MNWVISECATNTMLPSFTYSLEIVPSNLRILSAVLDKSKHIAQSSPSDIIAFSQMRSAVEHRLLSLPQRRESVSGQPTLDAYIYDAYIIAAQIYIKFALRTYRSDFPILRTLMRFLIELFYKHEQTALSIIMSPRRKFRGFHSSAGSSP